jgi:hypothetical protein
MTKEQVGWGMVTQDGDREDLQSLASLLADIERRLAEETDRGQVFRLRQMQQRCLLELYLLKRRESGKEGRRAESGDIGEGRL